MNARLPVLRHRVIPADVARERAGILSVMSSQNRTGDWEVPRHMRILSVMGSVELDLREARIPSGEITIEIVAMMGSVSMLFPPGVHVIADGSSLAGSWEIHTDPTVVPPPDAPVFRLIGSAFFASVEAHVRYPGERQRDARRRIKSA